MKCQKWPCPGNNPTIGVSLEYQTDPDRDTKVADRVWAEGSVLIDCPPHLHHGIHQCIGICQALT
eukprot:1022058-Karenia_brevis.AAC.1